MENPMRMAVLLTCHNRRDNTVECLDALYKASLPGNLQFEVFLVDDGSTDGTSEVVRDRYPDVNIIEGNGDLFWNRGMYLAWNHAAKDDFDFYLWLNDDTTLKGDALEVLIKDSAIKNNQSVICGTCFSEVTGEITYSGYEKTTHAIITPNGELQKCYFFNGNIVLVPRSVFKLVSYHDPKFHHGYGDFDYGLRANKFGVESFVSTKVLGYCEGNDLTIWCNPKYPFSKRLSMFYGPLGIAPFEHFIYAKRHFGILKALMSFFSQHLRLIYPSLWLKNK